MPHLDPRAALSCRIGIGHGMLRCCQHAHRAPLALLPACRWAGLLIRRQRCPLAEAADGVGFQPVFILRPALLLLLPLLLLLCVQGLPGSRSCWFVIRDEGYRQRERDDDALLTPWPVQTARPPPSAAEAAGRSATRLPVQQPIVHYALCTAMALPMHRQHMGVAGWSRHASAAAGRGLWLLHATTLCSPPPAWKARACPWPTRRHRVQLHVAIFMHTSARTSTAGVYAHRA